MMMKSKNVKDVFIILTSLLISSFFFYYFLTLHKAGNKEQKLVPVATVNIEQGSVYVKDEKSQNWIKIKSGNELFPDQEIMLSPLGVAEFSLINGTKILFLENSSFRIIENQNKIVLELLKNCSGATVKTTFSSLEIKTENNKILRLEENSTTVFSVNDGVVNGTTVTGKTHLEDGAGGVTTSGQGSGFISGPEAGVVRKPFVVISPLCYQKNIFSEEPCTILFEWKKNNSKIHFVEIEIFKDKNCQDKVFEQIVDADKEKYAVQLNQGLYFWRLSAFDINQEATGGVEQFPALLKIQ